ncbi:MAG TPA: aminoglycoside phosphotransferase family protein [Enhygromyxa sp.]|nr:aminoglycoside phosphotransferase family protein [Enhygromyxa sp.]
MRAIEQWVAQQLGPSGPWVRLDAMRGSTAVFGLTTSDGQERVVKQFRSARAYEQEHRALSRWFGAQERLGGARVPKLIAAAPELAALILERLPGTALDNDAEAAPDVHRAAGRFLAALHQLPWVDDDPLPLADALVRRTGAWLRQAPLEPEQARVVERHGPRPELFSGARRVPCHRDFAPRNWLWDGGRLSVLDFEHARSDLALVDMTKLCVGAWSQRPALAAAFFAGYGRSPSDLEREQLRALVVLHGVASLAWGHARDDVELITEGRRALVSAAAWSPEF